jgi:5-methylcytosine-specific restriction endonuclease McrA
MVAGYKALYGTVRWRRLSRLVIARAGGVCQVTPGCLRPATCADHIIPALVLAERGELHVFFALDNLRASCQRCNSAAGARLRNQRQRRRRLVTGEEAAIVWAQREDAYWEQVAAERARPTPRIY